MSNIFDSIDNVKLRDQIELEQGIKDFNSDVKLKCWNCSSEQGRLIVATGKYECNICNTKLNLKQVKEHFKGFEPKQPYIKWVESWLKDATYSYRVDSINKPNTGIDNPNIEDILGMMFRDSETLKIPIDRLKYYTSLWCKQQSNLVLARYRERLNKPTTIAAEKELQKWIEAVVNTGGRYSLIVMKHWFWQIKRKILGLEVGEHLMPVLIGKTGCGKTRAIELLVKPVIDLWMGCSLTDLSDERCWFKFNRGYIQVVEEMQKANKADIEAIKYIISTTTIDYRILGYNKQSTGRQCGTFIGTSNKNLFEIINDPTGVRRFWEIQCKDKIDREMVNSLNYELLWDCVDVNKPSPIYAIIDEIHELQDKYLRNKSPYDEFIEDQVVLDDVGFCSADQLWQAWRVWEGMNPTISKAYFYKQMSKLLKKYKKRISSCSGYTCKIKMFRHIDSMTELRQNN